MHAVTIAIDAMGGDHGAAVTVPAAIAALAMHPRLHIILVGDQACLRRELFHRSPYDSTRLSIRHASEVVGMDEKPSIAVRSKKDSSMRVAIRLVRDGHAQAIVSAGNTGALMALGRVVLKTFAGVDRPAIIAPVPTRLGHSHVLDLGANVGSTARQLYQFAVMGALLAEAVDDRPGARVALLNVGEEAVKGLAEVRDAAQMIQDSGVLNYVGFVEGNDIFAGQVDVVVCDGFVGNITLKASEELVRMIVDFLRAAFNRNVLTRMAGLVALPVLRSLRKRLGPAQNNGASLLGLRGIVVKSHGSADEESYLHAIDTALVEIERNVPERIRDRIEQLFSTIEPPADPPSPTAAQAG